MLTLKKVKELVGAPSHAKRTPSPKMLYEEGIVLLRREFDQGSHLTVYNSGYVLFSAGKRNTVFHIHDCCGDYAYDAAEGKGEFIGGYAMYGYCKDERNKSRLVVDEYAADVVRSIYRRKLEGMSAKAIAEQLNSEGFWLPVSTSVYVD